MGTETKSNCYKKNTTATTGGGIRPKVALNGSATAATTTGAGVGGIVGLGASIDQRSHATKRTLNQQQPQQQKNSSNERSSAAATPVFVPIHIGEDVIHGAKDILKVIRPHWDSRAVQFKKFTDGITNKLVGCFYSPSPPPPTPATTAAAASNSNKYTVNNGNDSENGCSNIHTSLSPTALEDKNDSGNINDTDTLDSLATNSSTVSRTSTTDSNVVLVRVYGNKTDLLIDRKAETRNIQLLHMYGFAPTLFATFKNGIVYDYVPGSTLKPTSVLEPKIWRLVASRLAEMHRRVKVDVVATDVGGAGRPLVPMLWSKMQSFFDLVPERFSDPEKHKRVEETFLPIKRLRDEFNALYRRLERLNSPVVFAHNDLLLGNIVYLETKQCVNFIDYEYADYNFQAFDIGNHFCEFAGVDEVDFSRYPKREFQLDWLRAYLQEYLQRSHVGDAEVERLYLQVNQFALSAHLLWTVWSLIQAEHSTIDFDYVDYAHKRYAEYQKRKSILMLKLEREREKDIDEIRS